MDDNLDLFPTTTTCQVGRLLASDIGRVSKWGQINSQTEISVNAWPAYFIPPTGQAHLPNKRAIVASIVQRGATEANPLHNWPSLASARHKRANTKQSERKTRGRH